MNPYTVGINLHPFLSGGSGINVSPHHAPRPGEPGWGGPIRKPQMSVSPTGGGANAPRAYNPLKGASDTIPAAINPNEAAILHMLGGAGAMDPNTGLYHFYNTNEGDDGGDEGGGYGTGRTSGTGTSNPENSHGYGDAMRGNGGGDSWSRNYQAMGDAFLQGKPMAYNGTIPDNAKVYGYEQPSKWKQFLGKIFGSALGGMALGPLGKYAGGAIGGQWGKGGWQSENYHDMPNGNDTEGGLHGNSDPYLYSDPVTGRQVVGGGLTSGGTVKPYGDTASGTGGSIIPTISGPGGTSSKGSKYNDQYLLDNLAGPKSGILDQLNSGLNTRVANANLDSQVDAAQKAADEQNAKRGMGVSTMQDATRSALGLSTANARAQNQLAGQNQSMQEKMAMLNWLNSNRSIETEQQRLALEKELGEKGLLNQAYFGQSNLNAAKNMNPGTDWAGILGQAASNVDWGSLFS